MTSYCHTAVRTAYPALIHVNENRRLSLLEAAEGEGVKGLYAQQFCYAQKGYEKRER